LTLPKNQDPNRETQDQRRPYIVAAQQKKVQIMGGKAQNKAKF
jgi:hypothetical protein